jgi:uncharacterized protein (UPF0332 family)
MTGHDFHSLAKQLASGTSEAEWRTSISRSYYGAFHVARTLLADLGFVIPADDKAHTHVYWRLNNCGVAVVRNAATDLYGLRRLRNRADYDLHRAVDASLTHNQVTIASGIIQTLDNLTPAERIQIRDAMIIYERDVLQNVTWQP